MQDKINIINFGFNPWSSFWKRNQTVVHLLSQLSNVNKVLFINNEVWVADALKRPHRQIVQPTVNNWRYIIPKKVTPKISSYTPIYFPLNGKISLVNRFNQSAISRIIRNYLDKPVLLVINNPNYTTRRLIDEVHQASQISIFDWSDDFKEFSNDPVQRQRTDDICRHYCQLADIVTTVNDRLSQQGKRWNKNTHTIKNATNYFTFKTDTKSKSIIRASLPKNKPIVGYIGYMNQLRLNLELIDYIVRQRPNYSFVFMGPNCEDLPLGKKLTKQSNVYVFDAVPYEEYVNCLSEFDVCILPNIYNPNTDGNDPIKLYDYLASGNPVVSTPTAGVEQFMDVIHCGRTRKEFIENIDLAVKNKPNGEKHRIKVAEQHSWQTRIKKFTNLINIEMNRKNGGG